MAAEHSEFLTEVLTVLVPLGDVRSRRMFGGHGLFLEDRMFALVSRDSGLFLKADDINRGAFAARGCKTHGKMPYFSVRPEALNSWQDMEPWATGAVAAAQRVKKPKRRKPAAKR
ncbi:MAG: TfoX/Sxy family protein [Alphaproteobacteria bacterium]|jgi:DNA transformation protein